MRPAGISVTLRPRPFAESSPWLLISIMHGSGEFSNRTLGLFSGARVLGRLGWWTRCGSTFRSRFSHFPDKFKLNSENTKDGGTRLASERRFIKTAAPCWRDRFGPDRSSRGPLAGGCDKIPRLYRAPRLKLQGTNTTHQPRVVLRSPRVLVDPYLGS